MAGAFLLVLLVFAGKFSASFWVFVVLMVTDALDGAVARVRGEVSDFGKIFDPVSDKIVVFGALVPLAWHRVVNPVALFLLLARDLVVDGFRVIVALKGVAFQARLSGKLKTLAETVACGVALLLPGRPIVDILLWVAVCLSVASGIDYFLVCRGEGKGEGERCYRRE